MMELFECIIRLFPEHQDYNKSTQREKGDTMENNSLSRLDIPAVRLVLMVLVVIMLNFGLFFILNIITPLAAGIVVGYLSVRIRDGVIVSFLGTILSYCIIFIISEWFLGFTTPAIDIIIAVLIMGLLGASGGLIGAFISSRTRN